MVRYIELLHDNANLRFGYSNSKSDQPKPIHTDHIVQLPPTTFRALAYIGNNFGIGCDLAYGILPTLTPTSNIIAVSSLEACQTPARRGLLHLVRSVVEGRHLTTLNNSSQPHVPLSITARNRNPQVGFVNCLPETG